MSVFPFFISFYLIKGVIQSFFNLQILKNVSEFQTGNAKNTIKLRRSFVAARSDGTTPPFPSTVFFPPPHLPPIITPPISTSQQKKAIDNHATTFRCRLRPIRANRSTVGVVARRLLCVWLVAAWGGGRGQAVTLPAPFLPRGSA